MNALLDCGHYPSPHGSMDTGYGTDNNGHTACYACCAENDKRSMRETGKTYLYLVTRPDGFHVTNWPASLDIKVKSFKVSRHNFGGKRIDFWFMFEGHEWHGYQIGQYNEVAHCKRNR